VLPDSVQLALDKVGMTEQHLGIVAFPLSAGLRDTSALVVHPDQPRQPGSTMKLVTATVALEQLGTNTRGRTDLLADTAPVGDVLPGPLYLRAGADTDLDWAALWTLLRQLREQGVRHIQGGLVVDRTMFNPTRLDIGVPPFDESPEFQYNAIPDALYLNGNMLTFVLQSDGQVLQARTSPVFPGVRIDTTAIVLTGQRCADWETGWKLPEVVTQAGEVSVVLRGSFPKHCIQQLELNLVDRQWTTAMAVRQLWQQLGGQLDGAMMDGITPAGATVLTSHLGRPFAEVARGMMKRSDNPLTRLVYLRLGAQAAAPGEETLVASARTVREWFDRQGIPTEGLVLDNGSGLSRSERISPAQLAALLLAASKGAHFPELLGTLPVAGVDGTLSRRLKGTAAEGRARLKTGTLRNTVGLAGFVQDASNREWVVVAFLNHDQASAKGRPVLDSVIEWVAGQR
jgi:D-alanyl-D-alanine carboxypeptidase/D-alanyl-D-alanine-endopeptidase (penicillin-binding protein 4)